MWKKPEFDQKAAGKREFCQGTTKNNVKNINDHEKQKVCQSFVERKDRNFVKERLKKRDFLGRIDSKAQNLQRIAEKRYQTIVE